MEENKNSSIKAAIILGVFILASVCIGGLCLIANTTLDKLLAELGSSRNQLSYQSSCRIYEELELPFSKGTTGVLSNNSYSGNVRITVAGKGQSAGSAYTDAFYLFTDGEGNSIPPEHPEEWILTINSKLAHHLIPDKRIPSYNDEHVYSLEIEAQGGVLRFGIQDGYAVDNTGSFSISICEH
jgi:hypothetical protein